MRTTLLLWNEFSDLDVSLQEEVSDCIYKTILGKGSPVMSPEGRTVKYLLSELQRRADMVITELAEFSRGSSLKRAVIKAFEKVASGSFRITMDIVTDKDIIITKTFAI